MTEKTGLYIHIPFCVRKCNYCAFLSFDAETSPRREYADAVVNEITRRAEELGHPEIDTVYVGGGTPSVLDLSQMRDIMHAVNKHFRVKEDAEVTIEANPATLGRKDGVMLAKLQAYKYMGFNRLSMGVQSMNNDRLRYLGRIHTAENVARDMELIRRKGFDNVNLDLMFSIPGESTADALDDLRRILAFSPEHISCYSLQIEEGTPFGEMAASGELTEIPDEDDRRIYHEICRMLDEAGYEHYEISNFAKKTDDAGGPSFYRSRHNSLYWDMSDYIGIGLGASGFTGGRRYKNTSDIAEYIEFFRELPIIGAGNIWRGELGKSVERTRADHMGMLATMINCLRMQDALLNQGVDAIVMASVQMNGFADVYDHKKAIDHLEKGGVVIFGGGIGIPFVSTDTATVVRAAEIEAETILMAKNVSGVFTADPKKDPDAKKYKQLSYAKCLADGLKATDTAASAIAMSQKINMYVFPLNEVENIAKVVSGEEIGTLVTFDSDAETILY